MKGILRAELEGNHFSKKDDVGGEGLSYIKLLRRVGKGQMKTHLSKETCVQILSLRIAPSDYPFPLTNSTYRTSIIYCIRGQGDQAEGGWGTRNVITIPTSTSARTKRKSAGGGT